MVMLLIDNLMKERVKVILTHSKGVSFIYIYQVFNYPYVCDVR